MGWVSIRRQEVVASRVKAVELVNSVMARLAALSGKQAKGRSVTRPWGQHQRAWLTFPRPQRLPWPCAHDRTSFCLHINASPSVGPIGQGLIDEFRHAVNPPKGALQTLKHPTLDLFEV